MPVGWPHQRACLRYKNVWVPPEAATHAGRKCPQRVSGTTLVSSARAGTCAPEPPAVQPLHLLWREAMRILVDGSKVGHHLAVRLPRQRGAERAALRSTGHRRIPHGNAGNATHWLPHAVVCGWLKRRGCSQAPRTIPARVGGVDCRGACRGCANRLTVSESDIREARGSRGTSVTMEALVKVLGSTLSIHGAERAAAEKQLIQVRSTRRHALRQCA